MSTKATTPSGCVFIATSLDGFIAKADGDVESWLPQPGSGPPEDGDCGYSEFMAGIGAIVLGRKSFEKVLSFPCEFPYKDLGMVVVITRGDASAEGGESPSLQEKHAEFLRANPNVEIMVKPESPKAVLEHIGAKMAANNNEKVNTGVNIDGGQTIQWFLEQNAIAELTLTRIPILLGAGIPLFGGETETVVNLKHCYTKAFLFGGVQSKYEVVVG
eukprot:TRINITY_DN70946_c0_g1_i1.p1 TRINITY_DN70946_c0_g1~~TRINITY_DN70946_c0_g1_i1.p1  ORF type:complete len:216 (+),score=36.25 TRINITY_DN70946_c0_g1_i1:113-760(+)